MLEFLKASLLVLHYHTLMTFLMMLSVIMLSMLMILLSILSVISHLDLWQQLELAFELESDLQDTMDCSKKWLVHWFHLTDVITLMLLM